MLGSAAADLAWRPRARDEATAGGRFPGLVRLGLWYSFGRRRGRLGRGAGRFRCGLGSCGTRFFVVLVEATVLVLAARATMARLVAPRSGSGRNGHEIETSVPYQPDTAISPGATYFGPPLSPPRPTALKPLGALSFAVARGWAMDTSWPATETVAVRFWFVVFGSARNVTVPLPEPLVPDVRLSQAIDSLAVHSHPLPAVTVKLTLPPFAAIVWLVGDTL